MHSSSHRAYGGTMNILIIAVGIGTLLPFANARCAASGYHACFPTGPLADFCCLPNTQCMLLAGNTTILCCPDGNICSTIQTVPCDIQQLNNALRPDNSLKTTALNATLPTCGTKCCPFGYQCNTRGNCEVDADQSKAPDVVLGSEPISSSSTAPTTTSSTTTTSSNPSSTQTTSPPTTQLTSPLKLPSNPISPKLAVGITLIVVITLLVLIFCIFFWWRRKPKAETKTTNQENYEKPELGASSITRRRKTLHELEAREVGHQELELEGSSVQELEAHDPRL